MVPRPSSHSRTSLNYIYIPHKTLMKAIHTLLFGLTTLVMVTLPMFAAIPKPKDAPKPLSPEESAKLVSLPKGFELQLLASEPLVRQPSGVCRDARGRLFVCELHGYNMEGQYDIEALNKTGNWTRLSDASQPHPKPSERPRKTKSAW